MKKFLKFLKYFFLTIFGIIFLTFLYFVISNRIFLESEDESNVSYLSENSSSFAGSFTDDFFDPEFYKSKVFLLGEIHGYADNQKLDKELVFFLNKKAGVKYYIAEMDSLTANKLNVFLSDSIKNEAVLKEVILNIKNRIPQQASQELFNKWNDIYDYNAKLPDSQKIKVFGIDKNFDDTSNTSRDVDMVNNFNNIVKKHQLENEKFYGLFGFFHVLQNATENREETFASQLKKSGVAVKSFVSFTLDSEMYLPKNPQLPTPENEKVDWINADGPLQLVKGINDLKAASKPNSITLFKIDGQNSPYRKSQNLAKIKSRVFGDDVMAQENTVTTDYFQYVFLLRNSKALTKLE